ATVNDANYQGSANATLVVAPASATVTLANLTQTWDSAPKPVAFVVSPAGLAVAVTYNGSTSAPSAPGTYSVVATVTDANYQGSATGVLTINPDVPVISAPTGIIGVVNQFFSYQVNASNQPASYNATGLPPGLSIDTASGLISGEPSVIVQCSVVLSASNPTGTGSATVGVTIGPSGLPAITSVSAVPSPATTGLPVSFSAAATQPDGQPLTMTWDFGDSTAAGSGNPATHTFTVTADAAFTVTVTASDGLNNVSKTLALSVLAPVSGGSGQPTPNTGAAATNPLDHTSVTVACADGGLVQLQVGQNGGLPPAGDTATTVFTDATGAILATVPGTQAVYKFTDAGIYLATVNLTNAAGAVVGTTELALPISAAETGTAQGTTPPGSMAITAASLKGKLLFNPKKADSLAFKGTVELPAGLDLSKKQTLWASLGNVIDSVSIDTKGKAKASTAGRLKSVAVKYPKLKKGTTVTIPKQTATVSFTLSAYALDKLGFAAEGISQQGGTKGVAVKRTVQAALVLGGTAYRQDLPVNFTLSKKGDTGQVAPGK
ncbi:MAG: MBG domain-containing protein, partial [Planctomycetota bacterium]